LLGVSDEELLRETYDRYGRSVYRRARTLLGDGDAAKDATQEVFLRAVTAGGLACLGPNPMAWLYRVTTNLCLNTLRDSKRRTALLAGWKAEDATSGDAEARIALRRILADVSAELQEIAVYYYVDGLSREEIAAIVDVSIRTVGNRLASFHEVTRSFVMRGAHP
jgi:RNA polymerase sigma-70 factor (ECF subfamily)